MSYNWYCYGQIKDKNEMTWKEFSKKPLSDNLKWYIDFDNEVPDCFERVFFDHADKSQLKKDIAQVFIDQFVTDDKFSCYDAYIVRLDKFVGYYANKIASIHSKLSAIFKCMGFEEDVDWNDVEEWCYTVSCDGNEKQMKQKSIPISKHGIVEIAKCISELEKYNYLLDIANVFESLAYDSSDYSNTNKSMLIVRE